MFFLRFSNANILFSKQELILRFYIIAKALSNTKQVKIIDRKKFAKLALNKNVEVFILYMTSLSLNSILIHQV